jgi:hypothetical protein
MDDDLRKGTLPDTNKYKSTIICESCKNNNGLRSCYTNILSHVYIKDHNVVQTHLGSEEWANPQGTFG